MSSDAKTVLLKRLQSRICREIPDRLALLITTKQSTAGEDIDLFAILDNAPANDPCNVEAYIKLIAVVKTVEKEIQKENGINVVDFSTFRIEHYHCRLMQPNLKGTLLRLHMLVYPTTSHFLSWENHSVISSICSNYTLLYGRKSVVDKIRACTKTVRFDQRIQPLVSLLFETYRNTIYRTPVPKETKRVLASEGLKKLEYAMRFILWELLREDTQEIPSAETTEILRLAKHRNIGGNIMELLEKTRNLNQAEISLSDVKLLYELSMSTVSTLISDSGGNRKNVRP